MNKSIQAWEETIVTTGNKPKNRERRCILPKQRPKPSCGGWGDQNLALWWDKARCKSTKVSHDLQEQFHSKCTISRTHQHTRYWSRWIHNLLSQRLKQCFPLHVHTHTTRQFLDALYVLNKHLLTGPALPISELSDCLEPHSHQEVSKVHALHTKLTENSWPLLRAWKGCVLHGPRSQNWSLSKRWS